MSLPREAHSLGQRALAMPGMGVLAGEVAVAVEDRDFVGAFVRVDFGHPLQDKAGNGDAGPAAKMHLAHHLPA